MPLQMSRRNSLPPLEGCASVLVGSAWGNSVILVEECSVHLSPPGWNPWGLFFPYRVNSMRLGTTAGVGVGGGSTSHQNSRVHFTLTSSISRKSEVKFIGIVLSAWHHKKKALWCLPICHSKGNHAERKTCLRDICHRGAHLQHRALFPGRKWNHSGQGKSWGST